MGPADERGAGAEREHPLPDSGPCIVYASFDPFPAPKGAAVHIGHFTSVLARTFGTLRLFSVAPAPGTPVSLPTGVEHVPLPTPGRTLIDRVLCFRGAMLRGWPASRPAVAHVRSIYEGYPIACRKRELCERLVFEVNGLPSIELKYHYPDAADDLELHRKLRAQEDRCLAAADLVIAPCEVTARYLSRRGVERERLRVIRNGVDPSLFPWRAPASWIDRPLRLLYSGTLSSWQGALVAVEALALHRRRHAATLTLAGPYRNRQRDEILGRAIDLGVRAHVSVIGPVDRAELARLHAEADVALAPLLANDRNLVQGCCPLKVIEAMAAGTPLVASDLPTVRELARPEVDALLVRPGSAKAIDEALLRLREDGELAPRLSRAARERAERELSWKRAEDELVASYAAVLGMPSRDSTPASARASIAG